MRRERFTTGGTSVNPDAINTGTTEDLAHLFRAAGSAHHHAFIGTDGNDPEWPDWYAHFLQTKLNTLMSVRWTRSEIVYLLLHAELERSRVTPRPEWTTFYAQIFLEDRSRFNSLR